MLIDDARICQSLRKIVTRLSADPALQQDLMQECLLHLWKLESAEPGRTCSWYLQSCRFYLQHWLASGRSLDSLKRANGDNRVSIDSVSDTFLVDGAGTNGELVEMVSARDIVSALARRLKPCESALLGGLADGMVLNDIAVKLKLSYPTALKYRRKIAAMTVKLGISPPPPYKRHANGGVRRTAGVAHRHSAVTTNNLKLYRPISGLFRPGRARGVNGGPRPFPKGFKPVITLGGGLANGVGGKVPAPPVLKSA
jgi:DNA-directed RNA polymerase specialized sigma24 family protein